jgi:hypothetical protein
VGLKLTKPLRENCDKIRRMLVRVISVTFLTVMPTVGQAQPKQSPTPGVCDVLARDLPKLNGKVIRVRGYISYISPADRFYSEGHYIRLSEDCKAHLVTKGLKWANDFSVFLRQDDERIKRPWEEIAERFKQIGANGPDRIWVTLVGRLETPDTFDPADVINENGRYGPELKGFGEHGDCPGEIVVQSIENVVVERRRENAPAK